MLKDLPNPTVGMFLYHLQDPEMWQHQQAAQGPPRLLVYSAVGPAGGSYRCLALVLVWQMACMDAVQGFKFDDTALGSPQLPACLSAQCLTDPVHALFCADVLLLQQHPVAGHTTWHPEPNAAATPSLTSR